MRLRRKFLGLLAGMWPAAIAGCGEEFDGTEESDDTEGSDDIEFQLPGSPTTGTGSLPLMNTETEYEVGTEVDGEGFELGDPADRVIHTVEANNEVAEVDFFMDHWGTGKVTGCGNAAFQTAWEAPATDDYVLEAEFITETNAGTQTPEFGSSMAATEFVLTVVDYDKQDETASSPAEFETARVSTGDGSQELEDFIIMIAISVALKKAFGLGLVARTVISEIVGSIINIQMGSRSGNRIDDEYYTDLDGTDQIRVEFSAQEGEILGIELSTIATVGYELENSLSFCYADCKTRFRGFRIQRA